VGDCKSVKIKNARHTHIITNEKNMKALVGGPLLVGGLGPGPPGPPLNPALRLLPLYFSGAVFTARGYAKRGICRRRVSVCVSVCLCVCHTPVLYQNG